MNDFIGFILVFTFLIPVIPAIVIGAFVVYCDVKIKNKRIDDAMAGMRYWYELRHPKSYSSNSYSSNHNESLISSNYDNPVNENFNDNTSSDWDPYVDPDDKEYDFFGSYGTEDDLADWDENVDF